ncbi:MAG TPA: germination protein YpeB [Bacillota bacterium]|nr:germination protein YpeB [Bacillota bacterium]
MRKWIIPAAVGVAALIAVGAWGYAQYRANRSMENFLNNKYQRSFFDMASQVQNIEVLLSKSLVAADPRLDMAFLTDIRQQAAFAQSNLGQLPLDDALAGRTAKFLTQIGDFADSLARELSQGESIDGKHWDTLNSLYQQSVELNRELQGIQYRVAQNSFYFGELVRQVRKNLQENPDNLAHTDFQALDKKMQRYPALIYDGPFSDHLERSEPRALSGQAEIGPEEAKDRALAFIEKRPGLNYRANVTDARNSRIPSYRVEVFPAEQDSDRTVLDISKQGGKVVWMLNVRPRGDPAVDMEQARQKAVRFLSDRGFGEMQSTYHVRRGNTVTFNFAAVQNGVTIYSDLVKATVALDNGEVIGAETSGYLMFHRRRDLPKASVSMERARSAINPRMEVTGGKLTLIPVRPDDEKLAYEFQGKLGGENYLIYVNAENGREENILKLIDTAGGTLTM